MSLDELTGRLREAVVTAAEDTLKKRGEPVSFGRLHCGVWEALARAGLLQRLMSLEGLESLPLELVREEIKSALEEETGQVFARHYEDQEERGKCLWWLSQPPADFTPLSEDVERVVHETLEAAKTIGTSQFMQAVYSRFPGQLTPDGAWVRACLESYGEEISPLNWALREEDRPEQRVASRKVVCRAAEDLGRRLGYDVQMDTKGFDVRWTAEGKDTLAFVVLDSAALSRLLGLPGIREVGRVRRLGIISEAHQSLLRLALARSMYLRKRLASEGWQFIRDLDLTDLASEEEATVADLDSLIGLDPLASEDRTQLSLI
jgi:hypothetical protein